jgi:acyl carrier protein
MLMSSAETIQARIFHVISRSKRINLTAVQPDRTFEELGIDSLDRLNLLFDLESEFGIEIDDEGAKQASKVSDIVAGIQQLLVARERVS